MEDHDNNAQGIYDWQVDIRSYSASNNISTEEGLATPQNSDDYQHFDFLPTETLPFTHIRSLGQGGQASVDQVEYISIGRSCVRKRWLVGRSEEDKKVARDELLCEADILKKLRQECHVITVLATYIQGENFGLLHLPIGQCDLNILLGKLPGQRRDLISDYDLERGIGCLSAALQYIHRERIRHKDIKPHNIIVHKTRLIFTDFGLSKDFSEQSTSLTNGIPVGTLSYYAPELVKRPTQKRGCATDVFSMGCVFLEILSVLFGETLEDYNGFRSLKPYSQKLEKVQNWIRGKSSSQNSALRKFWLEACYLMVAEKSSQRPRMSNVLVRLRQEQGRHSAIISASCCGECLEKHINKSTEGELDALRNTDFIWELGADTEQDYPVAIQPNSYRGPISGFLWPLVSPFRLILPDMRWYLTIYLDNGRPLMSYGTVPAKINYSYSFGEALVDRVVFKAGTFVSTVAIYEEYNWKDRCFRSWACDVRFEEPKRARSYMVEWDMS